MLKSRKKFVNSKTNKFLESTYNSNFRSGENTTDTFFSKTGESFTKNKKNMFCNPELTIEKLQRKESMKSRSNSRESDKNNKFIRYLFQNILLKFNYRSRSTDDIYKLSIEEMEVTMKGSIENFKLSKHKHNFQLSATNGI
jgi:hypothetical protein